MILDLFYRNPTYIIPFMGKKIVISVVFLCAVVASALAQNNNVRLEIPGTSAGVIVQSTDFRFDGTAPSEVVFQIDGLAYGVFYNRGPVFMRVVRGTESIGNNDNLVLTDFTLSGSAAIQPWKDKTNQQWSVFFPIGLQSNYRRIKRTQGNAEIDAFEYTVVAIGSGIGLDTPLANGLLTGKGMGYFGIANRSFSYDTDTSAILEASLVWSSVRLTERFGISVGYNYRWQKWYSDLGEISGSSYNFVGSHHAFQVGLSF